MRILIATETYRPDVNGVAYFVQRLASRMTLHGHEVHVMCPAAAQARTGGGPVQLHELPSRAIPRYPQLRVARLAQARRAVREAMTDCQPDVVHVQNHFAVGRAAVAEARQRSIPVVGTNHFLPTNLLVYLPVPSFVNPLIARLLWWRLGRVYRGLTAITAPTQYAARLTERACHQQVGAVSCGVDGLVFRPDVSSALFRKRYELPEGPTILVVGRLDPEKHVEEVISALPLVREQVDAHLVVVGRGEQRRSLERLAGEKGLADHVTFCGFVADDLMPEVYAAADVYCHAGRAELQSISTLEAMASGKPIVAADACALPLLVTEEVNGYLYPPGAADLLSQRLCTLLTDDGLRLRMSDASREAVLQHSVEQSAAEFEAIYARAISSVAADPADLRGSRVRTTPRHSGIGSAVGGLAAFSALAAPVLIAVVRPEPAHEHADLIVSYLAAAISALLSLRLAAIFGAARIASLPGWVEAIAARRALSFAIATIGVLGATLVALAGRGAL